MHKVIRNFSLPIDTVDKLVDAVKTRPRMNMSMIVEDALDLWFKQEYQNGIDEYFKENPEKDF